jgi:hypothetical protein
MGKGEKQRELAPPVLDVNRRRGQRWLLMGEDKGEAGLLLWWWREGERRRGGGAI